MRELDQVDGNFGFKVNHDWVLKRGLRSARKALPDRPAFFDDKMWNGASTMTRTFLNVHQAGFDLMNAYALAGGSGAEKKEGLELRKSISEFRKRVGKGKRMHIYAVTILTHYGDDYCIRHFGAPQSVIVRKLAEESIAARADGIIAPGTSLSVLDDLPTLICFPGVRPIWYADDRHEREIRPEEIAGREDLEAVCGSPIMTIDDPVDGLKKILSALQS